MALLGHHAILRSTGSPPADRPAVHQEASGGQRQEPEHGSNQVDLPLPEGPSGRSSGRARRARPPTRPDGPVRSRPPASCSAMERMGRCGCGAGPRLPLPLGVGLPSNFPLGMRGLPGGRAGRSARRPRPGLRVRGAVLPGGAGAGWMIRAATARSGPQCCTAAAPAPKGSISATASGRRRLRFRRHLTDTDSNPEGAAEQASTHEALARACSPGHAAQARAAP
jgi:hypothetical protein